MIFETAGNTRPTLTDRIIAFSELAKPELTGLSVLTAVVAYALADDSAPSFLGALGLAVGTLLVGAGAGTLNQVLERDQDALMKRTEGRPIPTGRVRVSHGTIVGAVLAILGVAALLAWFGPIPAGLALLTLALYLGPYTELKRRTWLNTLIGAIPGAMPVLIGWTASSDKIGVGGWTFFGILYLWQIPHFLSLAWLYRKDYSRASFRMLSTNESSKGLSTGLVSLLSSIGLTGLSVYFGYQFRLDSVSTICNATLGIVFSAVTLQLFSKARTGDHVGTNRWARIVFFASLVYLPAFMLLVLLGRQVLPSN